MSLHRERQQQGVQVMVGQWICRCSAKLARRAVNATFQLTATLAPSLPPTPLLLTVAAERLDPQYRPAQAAACTQGSSSISYGAAVQGTLGAGCRRLAGLSSIACAGRRFGPAELDTASSSKASVGQPAAGREDDRVPRWPHPASLASYKSIGRRRKKKESSPLTHSQTLDASHPTLLDLWPAPCSPPSALALLRSPSPVSPFLLCPRSYVTPFACAPRPSATWAD